MTVVPSFSYLGRTVLSSDDDWSEVEQNLRRARGKWGQLAKILGREGSDRRTVGRFYVAVVQSVLIFRSKMWVVSPRLDKLLNSFHRYVVRQMSGMVPKLQRDGTWVYTPIGAALEMVGLEDIGVYIARHQNTVAQYIETCPIMDLCLMAERKTGLRLSI